MQIKIRLGLPKPHTGQRRVMDQARRFNVLQCGRRFGKTRLGLLLDIITALEHFPSAWFAPSYKLLSEVWRDALRLLAPIRPKINVQEKRIEIPGNGVIDFWSLDQPDAGRGRKYKRVVIDEAGLVRNLDSAWQEAIRPMLADYQGDAWFLGTPKGHNFFHRLYTRGQDQQRNPDWASWRMPTSANPHISKAEIESARADMPPSAFDQEFLGIPAADGGNPFGLASIARCIIPELAAGPVVCYGVDLAKAEDWTVVCGLNATGHVCRLERWQSDWEQTTRRIYDLAPIPLLIDSTGVGDPIVERLQKIMPGVRGYGFTQRSKQQLMEGLAAGIQRTEVRFPDGWLRDELEAFEYEYRPGGGVRYTAPQGLHDDGVCALALAWERFTSGPRAWGPEDMKVLFGKPDPIKKSEYEILRDKLLKNLK